MTSDELSAMIEKHKLDPNYQYKDTPWDDIVPKAKASFQRLSPEKQAKVLNVCVRFGVTDPLLIAKARFMAQTNLFFLCKLVGYKDVSDKTYVWTDGKNHNTHEEICNDFFVRKDPTYKTFKEFAAPEAYIGKKQRLLLVPRGGFKSTMNMADTVQWIISFPEITVLVLSGVLKLAEKFIGEIKSHFTLEEGSPEYNGLFFAKKNYRPKEMDGHYSTFQMLFAEHCIAVDDGKASEFQTPATPPKGKEPTVFAASIEQNLAGFHVAILKLDDVVTNENSLTNDRIKGVNKQVSINQAMLHPYGFYDKIGTWYDLKDTYGVDIANAAKYKDKGLEFPMVIYIRPAWWANDAAKKAGKISEEMQKSDYELWFNEPGQLTYEFLAEKFINDEYFPIKYLNDPTQLHAVKFPRELLLRHTITAHEVPGTGMMVTAVDTAYSQQSWADYSVIITALIYGGRFFVIDMKRGRYNEYELPGMIAATALQWHPKVICIEDSGKAEKYVQREVYREMDKLKVRVPLRLVSLGQGTSKKSKAAKAGPVLRYIGSDRLKFVNTCPSLEDLYTEMGNFGTASQTHDDIVDALSIMVNEFAGYADMEAKITAASTDYVADPKMKQFYDQTYGLGKYEKFNASNMNAQLEFPDQAPDVLAKQAAEAADFTANDPFADLIG